MATRKTEAKVSLQWLALVIFLSALAGGMVSGLMYHTLGSRVSVECGAPADDEANDDIHVDRGPLSQGV